MKGSWPVAGLVGLLLGACSPDEAGSGTPQRPESEEVIETARAAAQAAFQRLSGELAGAIAEGGPTHAIPLCSDKAGSLTAEVASTHELTMVRLSDRPRNPGQRAGGEDLAALESMRNSPGPRVEWRDDGGAVVRLPIVLDNPLCLKCHGGDDDIAPDTRRQLAELYPADKATGYELGDLRGIWRIEVPAGR